MRIGLIIYGDINTLSGGYLYDRKLLEYLRQRGDEVEIISLKQPSYINALLQTNIPDEFQNKQFDILIQDELAHPSFLPINRQLKTQLQCPIVSLVHLFNSFRPVPFYKKFLFQIIERAYLKTVDGLIVNSQSTLNQAKHLLSIALPEHVVAVPCGDNFARDDILKTRKASAGLKLLYVGNITEQKGLHVLLRALVLLQNKDIQLTVVGREDVEPSYAKSQKKYVKKYTWRDQVSFRGAITGEDLKAIYQAHDVFVMPSVNEAYGIVYLEAMQFGLPVIGTNSGGGKEIIKDEQNGFLINAGNSATLAEKIISLKNDSKLFQKLANNARRSYLDHPVWVDTCDKVRNFLYELGDKRESK